MPRRRSRAAPSSPVSGITPYVTANDDFYRIDTALSPPDVPADTWSLRIHGMVDHEIELDFTDLLARPLVERRVTLTCVSNEVGGDLVGNATWLGVPLADLLDEAGVQDGADALLSTQRRRVHRRARRSPRSPTGATRCSPSG